MLTRKSDQEIERILCRRRFSPKNALIISLFLTPIFCGYEIFYGNIETINSICGFAKDSPFRYIELIFTTYFYGFFCFYIRQLLRGPFRKTYYICSECLEYSNFKLNQKCSCGGKLEPDFYYELSENAQPENQADGWEMRNNFE